MKRIIALAGPKHSGKTCAGKVLAELTGARFFDLDDEIQACAGKSARDLYREGRDVFQAGERAALAEVLRKAGDGRTVVALGGGFIDNQEAGALLAARGGRIVFLAVSAQTAWSRIVAAQAESGELPAFLQTAHPQETHREIHERRAAACQAAAALVVDAEHKSAAEIAAKVAAEIATGGIWESNTP
jgi:shikimate kinase